MGLQEDGKLGKEEIEGVDSLRSLPPLPSTPIYPNPSCWHRSRSPDSTPSESLPQDRPG